MRDLRTPGARRNQRVVLPLMLVATAILVVGLALKSEAVVIAGGAGVMLLGAAWRWV